MKNLIVGALVLGGVAYGGSKWYLHHKVESGLDNAVMMMSPYAEITYKGVSSTMTGELTINGLRANIEGFDDDFYVDSFGIDTPSFLTLLDIGDIATGRGSSGSEFPKDIGLIVEGVRIPVDADYYQKIYDSGIEMLGEPADIDDAGAKCVGKYGHSPKALADLGYDEQNLSFAMYMNISELGESISMSMSVEEMWDLEFDIKLAGSQVGLTRNALAGRKLGEFEMVLTDRSLNERVNKYCERLGLSPEETLQARMDALSFFGDSNGIVFDEYVLDPYQEYLAGKSTLTVTAKPNSPVNFSQISLYKPSDVPALLNLSAVAE